MLPIPALDTPHFCDTLPVASAGTDFPSHRLQNQLQPQRRAMVSEGVGGGWGGGMCLLLGRGPSCELLGSLSSERTCGPPATKLLLRGQEEDWNFSSSWQLTERAITLCLLPMAYHLSGCQS